MVEFISNLINNDYLSTIILSFVPLIELKGGIIFAQGVGFNIFLSLILALLGSTVSFFLVFFALKPILSLLKKWKWFNKFATKIENYFTEVGEDALNKQTKGQSHRSVDFIKKMTVFIFVAIPLPMTGVWTGTAIAVFLNLSFKDACPMVILGNFIAGAIMSVLAVVCTAIWGIQSLNVVLWILFALAIILLVIFIVKIITKRTDGQN